MLEEAFTGDVVGIEDQIDLALMLRHGFLQRRRFTGGAAIAEEGGDPAGVVVGVLEQNRSRVVDRAVVDWYDQQPFGWIVARQQRVHGVPYHPGFVVRGNEHDERRPIGLNDVDEGLSMSAEKPVQREEVVTDRVDREHDDAEPETDIGERDDRHALASSRPSDIREGSVGAPTDGVMARTEEGVGRARFRVRAAAVGGRRSTVSSGPPERQLMPQP